MNGLPAHQKGASAIGTIIILALIGYAAYIGIQYVPQAIESKTIDSILDTVRTESRNNPVSGASDAKSRVIKLLQINEMNDMTEAVSVKESGGRTTVTFKYDRELNLLFKTHPMQYTKSLVL